MIGTISKVNYMDKIRKREGQKRENKNKREGEWLGG